MEYIEDTQDTKDIYDYSLPDDSPPDAGKIFSGDGGN